MHNFTQITRPVEDLHRELFKEIAIGYNAIVYPTAITLIVLAVRPVLTCWRALEGTEPVADEEVAAARWQALRLPIWFAVVTDAGAWYIGGLLIPLVVKVLSPENTIVHFMLAHLVSGLIALAYSLCGTLFVVLRVLYPGMWVDGGLQRDGAEELAPVSNWLWLARFGGVGSAGGSGLSFGDGGLGRFSISRSEHRADRIRARGLLHQHDGGAATVAGGRDNDQERWKGSRDARAHAFLKGQLTKMAGRCAAILSTIVTCFLGRFRLGYRGDLSGQWVTHTVCLVGSGEDEEQMKGIVWLWLVRLPPVVPLRRLPRRAFRGAKQSRTMLSSIFLYCGVCHSDLHTARNEWSTWPTVYPCVPGHEIVGRVTKVGPEVTRFKPGDYVAVGCMVDSCGDLRQLPRGARTILRQRPHDLHLQLARSAQDRADDLRRILRADRGEREVCAARIGQARTGRGGAAAMCRASRSIRR